MLKKCVSLHKRRSEFLSLLEEREMERRWEYYQPTIQLAFYWKWIPYSGRMLWSLSCVSKKTLCPLWPN
jgi:hypothetical protein